MLPIFPFVMSKHLEGRYCETANHTNQVLAHIFIILSNKIPMNNSGVMEIENHF